MKKMDDIGSNDLDKLIAQFVANVDLTRRVCETHEEVDGDDAVRYNHACDYPQNSDPGLVVEELRLSFERSINGIWGLEIGPGPGYLCRELMNAGASLVVGVDPSRTMIEYVQEKYPPEITQERMRFVSASVYDLPTELLGRFDLVVCQNSLHQLGDPLRALKGMVGAAKKEGGEVHIFDFRRDISLDVLSERIGYTKPEIWRDLAGSICAALTKDEVRTCLDQIPGIYSHVRDAVDPQTFSARALELIRADPVPHYRDYNLSQKIKIKRYA